jgi:hypothetical protein
MQPHSTTLYVALDIGKNVDWLGAYAGYELKPVMQPLEVRSDRPGLERVTAIIDGLLSCGLYERSFPGDRHPEAKPKDLVAALKNASHCGNETLGVHCVQDDIS